MKDYSNCQQKNIINLRDIEWKRVCSFQNVWKTLVMFQMTQDFTSRFDGY